MAVGRPPKTRGPITHAWLGTLVLVSAAALPAYPQTSPREGGEVPSWDGGGGSTEVDFDDANERELRFEDEVAQQGDEYEDELAEEDGTERGQEAAPREEEETGYLEPEEPSEEPCDQEPYEFIVTTTRLDTSAGNVPETVTIIDDEEVRARSAVHGDDVVRTAASVSVRRPQGPSNIFPHILQIRGVSGIDRVLVLLDGLPLNNALSGDANLNLLPTERVHRVEIIRGPYSALWGSYAMGGVINLMTKPGGMDSGAAVQALAGPFDTAHLSASASRRLSGLEASASYDFRTTENYLAAENESNLDYQHHRAIGRLDIHRGEELSAIVTGGLFYSDTGFVQYVDLRDVPGLEFYLRNEGRSEKDDQFIRLAGIWRTTESLDLRASASLMNQWSTFFTVPIPLEGNVPELELYRGTYDAREWRLEGSGRWSLASWAALVVGVDQVWDFGGWENTDLEDGSVIQGMNASASVSAGYGQFELTWLDHRLRFIAGARVDRHSTFGVALSPKGGIFYEPIDGIILRLAGGRAFRSPSLMELYSPPWLRIPPYYTKGNDRLEPETLWSLDGGIEQYLPWDLVARVTGFWVEAQNQITFELQSDGIERYINSEGYRTLGVETELSLPSLWWFDARLNYTYTYRRDFATDEPIIYVPDHLVGFLLHVEVPVDDWLLSGAFDLRFVGSRWYANPRSPEDRRELPEHVVGNLNLRARYGPLAVFTDIRNLWNEEYEETNGFLSPRFQFLVGARMEMESWALADW